MNDLAQMHNDLQSFQDEQTEMLKDWEDAMAYLDSKGIPQGPSLMARIIMYKGDNNAGGMK
jgi:hypothetical protein